MPDGRTSHKAAGDARFYTLCIVVGIGAPIVGLVAHPSLAVVILASVVSGVLLGVGGMGIVRLVLDA